jgi:hypothetical protein
MFLINVITEILFIALKLLLKLKSLFSILEPSSTIKISIFSLPTSKILSVEFRTILRDFQSLYTGRSITMDLSKINKEIIYACGTGFGLSGPLKEIMGHESVAEALGGFLGRNGEPGRKPRRAPAAVADASTGLHLTVGILLALNARHRTGEGQIVDVSLLDSVMWMQGWEVSTVSNLDKAIESDSNPLDSGVYEASDGLIVMSGLFIPNPLKNISEVIGVEDLSEDKRFKSMEDIAKNASERFLSGFGMNNPDITINPSLASYTPLSKGLESDSIALSRLLTVETSQPCIHITESSNETSTI